MRPERIYLTQELAELTDIAGDESLEHALTRVGAVSVTAVRVVVPAMTMTIGIFGTQSFDAVDGAVLRRLIPYLHAAARGAARTWRERLHATLSADLAFRNSLGWFLLNRDGVVLESRTASADFLSTDRILSGIVGERLGLADRVAEMALNSVLERLENNVTPRTMALWVSQDPPLHLRIAPVSGEWMFDPREPKSLATLYGECRLGRDIIGLLTDLFGLLPSEARLAAALGDGDRLTEAADRLGLTIETARNYSKKIFAKTGTRGQADLVRLILSNGLAELDYSIPVARS
jgi:DNA-binding CsgD family transcriptional regulator